MQRILSAQTNTKISYGSNNPATLRFIKLRYFIVVGVGVGGSVLVVALFARLICLAPVNSISSYAQQFNIQIQVCLNFET
jgi:hypothetical protein